MRIGLIAPPAIPVPPPAYGGTEGGIGHEITFASRMSEE